MVKPTLHRRGIGTAMLLARLAALPPPVKPVRIMLSNVAAAEGSFARFGFAHQGQMPVHPGGSLMDVKAALLDATGWQKCRAVVHGLGIEPTDLPPVPTFNTVNV